MRVEMRVRKDGRVRGEHGSQRIGRVAVGSGQGDRSHAWWRCECYRDWEGGDDKEEDEWGEEWRNGEEGSGRGG